MRGFHERTIRGGTAAWRDRGTARLRAVGRRAGRVLAACLLALAGGQDLGSLALPAARAASPDDGLAPDRPLPGDAGPLDTGRLRAFAVFLDNDSLATWPHDDRWYTSGVGLRWIHEAGGTGLHARVGEAWCAGSACGDGARIFRVTTLVQRLYNPADSSLDRPQPNDRPYAGWLAIGSAVVLREPSSQARFEVQLGVIGPGALGEPVQNGVHRLLGLDEARGWRSQLRPRATLQFGAAGLGRHRGPLAGLDGVHRVALDVGTVTARASAGAMLRWGTPPDGPTWPTEPLAPWVDGDDESGRFHLFAGFDARAVGYDRLVDGEAFEHAPAVRPEPLVGEVFAGASFALARAWRLDFSMTLRSAEFEAPGDPADAPAYRRQRFGTLQLRWAGP